MGRHLLSSLPLVDHLSAGATKLAVLRAGPELVPNGLGTPGDHTSLLQVLGRARHHLLGIGAAATNAANASPVVLLEEFGATGTHLARDQPVRVLGVLLRAAAGDQARLVSTTVLFLWAEPTEELVIGAGK